MSIQAYFENIQEIILEELSNSKKSIIIAVAWFTDHELFQMLCNKANESIQVELLLLNDKINKSSGIDYDRLINIGGKLWRIETSKNTEKLMHNKFCVIDNNIVISGSYNWTKKARLNHESITIISGNEDLADKFTIEFKSILELHFGKDPYNLIIDYSAICNRLITLREAIRTGDPDAIDYLAKRLLNYLKPYKNYNISKVYQILQVIEEKRYSELINLINELINSYSSITSYIDPNIVALRLELKALEIQISALEDEKVEVEKQLHDFELQHNKELGDLIIKILKVRKELLKLKLKEKPELENAHKEAEEDYKNYHNGYSKIKAEQSIDLSSDEKKELKEIFRLSSKLCHPDTVSENEKTIAEEIFKSLNTAYRNNDIKEVRKIYANLKNKLFNLGSDTISEEQQLIKKIIALRNKRINIEKAIDVIKNSEIYMTINEIENWHAYLDNVKQQLTAELYQLEIELTQWKKI